MNMMLFFGSLVWFIFKAIRHDKKNIIIQSRILLVCLTVVGLGAAVLDIYSTIPVVNFYIMPIFIMGGMTYSLCKNLELRGIEKIPAFLEIVLVLISVVLLDLKHIGSSLNTRTIDYLIGLGSCLLLLCCYYGGLTKKALTKKALTVVGNISYEFYLVHFLVLLVLRKLYNGKNTWQILMISFAASILFASGMKTIDKRLRDLLKG